MSAAIVAGADRQSRVEVLALLDPFCCLNLALEGVRAVGVPYRLQGSCHLFSCPLSLSMSIFCSLRYFPFGTAVCLLAGAACASDSSGNTLTRNTARCCCRAQLCGCLWFFMQVCGLTPWRMWSNLVLRTSSPRDPGLDKSGLKSKSGMPWRCGHGPSAQTLARFAETICMNPALNTRPTQQATPITQA